MTDNAGIHTMGREVTLTVLSFFSGFCALSYEVLYLRLLTTVLGDMFYVHAALLSTFLIGIGLGAKFAHKVKKWLFLAEILTGMYAFLLPRLLHFVSARPVIRDITANPGLTIVVTVIFLFLPSLFIGLSIPLFSAYLKKYSAGRLVFQGVYGAYNLGAMLGVLSIELAVIRVLGITDSIYLVGAVNLVNGMLLLFLREGWKIREIPSALKPRSFAGTIILALALGSFASAVFQMFFLKLTYLVFGPHRENFAIGLGISLLGLPLGAWLVARFRLRFVTLLLWIPLVTGFIYANYIPLIKLYQATSPWVGKGALLIFVHKFVFGALFALGPMILFGALLPALMQQEEEVARESGHLLWISCLANAAGYLAYVLVGHPLLTSDQLLLFIALAALIGSLLAVGCNWSKEHYVYGLVGVLLMVLVVGQWEERNFYLAQWIDLLKEKDNVSIYKSGAESATLVRAADREWLSYNGHPSITVRQDGLVNRSERIGGVILALDAPRLDRALVLGFGTGATAGTVSRIFADTDVVEINKAFYKMMPDIHYANLDIEQNATATLHLGDGRAFLAGKEDEYDAIMNSIPAPTYFSASKIYTLEFYDRVVKALKPDGIFCTWFSVGDMSESGIYTMLSTLRRKFRYCRLRLLRGAYYEATCSNTPVHSRRFSELSAHPSLHDSLSASLAPFDLDEFFEDILLSPNVFAHFSPGPLINTDDKPVLEFLLQRKLQQGKMGDDLFLLQPEEFDIDPVRRDEAGDPDRMKRRARVYERFSSRYYKKFFLPHLN